MKLPFNTSSKNYVDLVIYSDFNDYKIEIRIGGKDDQIELFETVNGETTSLGFILQGGSHDFDAIVHWTYLAEHNHFVLTCDGHELSFTPTIKLLDSSKFELRIQQSTASFFGKHYMSYIYVGKLRKDTIPPVIESVLTIDSATGGLYFNEPMDTTSGFGRITSNQIKLAYKWLNTSQLQFVANPKWLENLPNFVHVLGFKDLSGNLIHDTTCQFWYYHFHKPDFFDVLINELMIDPEPVVGLPPVEYVELYNLSKRWFNLKGWSISDAGKGVKLPEFILKPDSFVVLWPGDEALPNEANGNYLLVEGLPSLNNDQDSIALYFGSKKIHEVSYSKEWFNDERKNAGGWSMELVDPNNPCGELENWRYSADPRGGSPGKVNSVHGLNPDRNNPVIESYGIWEDLVSIKFNKAIHPMWQLDPEPATTTSSSLWIDSVEWTSSKELSLHLNRKLEQGEIENLLIQNLEDCARNSFQPDTLLLVRPVPAKSGDIKFNEVLFDPYDGGAEFLELIHVADYPIDLCDLVLFRLDGEKWLDPYHLCGGNHMSFPGDIWALTADGDLVKRFYHCDSLAFIQMPSFPSLPNDEGALFLKNRSLKPIDSLRYESGQHFELLDETKGVSLERINPKISSANTMNWVSASTSSGFATPGLPNSQHQEGEVEDLSEISLENNPFTPNNDGIEDRLIIRLQHSEPNTIAHIRIFDLAGNMIREIAKDFILGTENQLFWDGITDYGRLATPGMYILLVQGFTKSGKRIKLKRVVSVAY